MLQVLTHGVTAVKSEAGPRAGQAQRLLFPNSVHSDTQTIILTAEVEVGRLFMSLHILLAS